MKIYHEDQIVLEKSNWSTNMSSSDLTLTMKKVLESMKINEKSTITIKNSFIEENDNELFEMIGKLGITQDLTMDVDLIKFI